MRKRYILGDPFIDPGAEYVDERFVPISIEEDTDETPHCYSFEQDDYEGGGDDDADDDNE